jgi:O-antigen/teichoic acid export membrane protein
VLVLITLALLTDSLTNIPSMVNDALGHPRISGRFALARGLLGIGLVYLGAKFGGIIGAASAHLIGAVTMTTLFLVFVHGRTVPIAFGDTLREGWGRSIAVGILIFAFMFPLKWLLPSGLSGTLLIVSAAVISLAVAGITLIVRVDERTALLAAARRLRNSM